MIVDGEVANAHLVGNLFCVLDRLQVASGLQLF